MDEWDPALDSWNKTPAVPNLPHARKDATAFVRQGEIWLVGGSDSQVGVCVYTQVRVCVCTHKCVCVCVHTSTCVCVYTQVRVCVGVCINTRTCVCGCVYKHNVSVWVYV